MSKRREEEEDKNIQFFCPQATFHVLDYRVNGCLLYNPIQTHTQNDYFATRFIENISQEYIFKGISNDFPHVV